MKLNYEILRSDIVQKRMVENRLTTRQAAAQIGISAATLSRVETKHNIDVDTLFKILTWLNQNIDRYITFE